jgi:VWFA-related protein
LRSPIHLKLLTLLLCANILLQAHSQQNNPPSPGSGATVLQTGTQLVVVDVVVQSKDGHPVHGLKEEMFRLTENGLPQQIRHFEEHTNHHPATNMPAVPKLPPGTFTDYSPVPPDDTLNILLLDALNTPTKDQSYVRNQLQEFVKHANPGTRIAIFGLANQLVLLQGFTADPDTLKEAINHKLIPRFSSLLDDPGGSGVDQLTASDAASGNVDLTSASGASSPVAQAAANFQQFEAETEAIQTQMRLQHTLDAFNSLAHYLATFPGRKNLIWFSGSFPLNVLPNPALQNPFAVANLNEDEFRETTNLLTKAQVAVYPVDARGLVPPPMYSASTSGRRYGSNPAGISAAVSAFNSSQAAEHTTMDTLADSTGGRAYYNTNALSDAVAKAIEAGANYYTFSYTPSEHKQDGRYCKIDIVYTGSIAGGVPQLSYRHGYYANDATQKPASQASASVAQQGTGGPAATAAAFQRAAMSRGAPTPQDMLFTVRVLPASTSTEAAVAAGNQLSADVSSKGPFRRYDIDYVALSRSVTLTQQPDGRHQGAMEFLVYVFDVDGKLLNADGSTISLDLNASDYAKFERNAIQVHLEVSAPAKLETFLRVGVRDIPSNRFGVVEIPTSSISHLPPAVYPNTSKPTSSQTNQAPGTPKSPE